MNNYLKFFFIFLLTFSITENIFSATVSKTKKKKRIVYINLGKNSGIKKGMKVCFKDADGNEIVCDKVVKVLKKVSIVKIKDKKKFKKIKKGTEAAVDEIASLDKETSSESNSTEEESQSQNDANSKFLAFRLLYTPEFIAQSAYNEMYYLPPRDGQVESTLWEKGDRNKMSLLSLTFETELLRWNIAAGLRYRAHQDFPASADYAINDSDVYVDILLKSSAFGIYFDYYFLKPKINTSGFRIGSGLDIDMSKVTYVAKEISTTDESNAEKEIYSLRSNRTIMSLRIPIQYELNISTFGVNGGLNLLVPLYATDTEQTASINDTNISEYEKGNDASNKTAAEEDLNTSLNHNKSSFGLELIFGVFYKL
ncbi:MAG: hypothetical protein R3B45_10490 [Bdellovibrionota bacterium]